MTQNPAQAANALFHDGPITTGTPVLAWPGSREGSPLVTRTRGEVWRLGDGTRVVAVVGHAGGIALTHVDVLPAATAGVEQVTAAVLEAAARAGRRATLDPGALVPRGCDRDGCYDRMDQWQERALLAAVAALADSSALDRHDRDDGLRAAAEAATNQMRSAVSVGPACYFAEGWHALCVRLLTALDASPAPSDDRHPEDYCHRCQGPNISWYTPGTVWDPVMRTDPTGAWKWQEIICPLCFVELAGGGTWGLIPRKADGERWTSADEREQLHREVGAKVLRERADFLWSHGLFANEDMDHRRGYNDALRATILMLRECADALTTDHGGGEEQ